MYDGWPRICSPALCDRYLSAELWRRRTARAGKSGSNLDYENTEFAAMARISARISAFPPPASRVQPCHLAARARKLKRKHVTPL